jgi:predicted methyltransferase
MMNRIIAVLCFLVLAACQPSSEETSAPAAEAAAPAAAPVAPAPETNRLQAVLDAQPDEVKARYRYRHPRETLEFFGIEPGMTVIEGLPGRGWYTKVLLPYLGAEGRLVGANYALDMWPNFSFADEEFLRAQSTWTVDWPAGAEAWRGDDGAAVDAFNFGAMPEAMIGKADAVFLVRVLHNLARFESEGGFLTEALADSYAALKPGGILGIVQHHARDEMSDEFADGSHGYLKQGFVIAAAEAAGFEFVAASDVNANPLDRPSEDDVVWRLPPSLAGSDQDEYQRARLEEIGESNRMTLKLRKPEQD